MSAFPRVLLFLLAFPCPASAGVWGAPPPVGEVGASSAPWVHVIWPPPGLEYPYVKESFTLGNVKPGSTLTVNGLPMRVEADGGFLDMVPFSTGSFTLYYAAEWGGVFSTTSFRVQVAQPDGLPATGEKELRMLEPAEDLEVRSGDLITLRCKGPPGREGVSRIDGLTGKLPLAERRESPGVYEGHYRVQPGDRGESLRVKCGLKGGFWGGLSAEAKGKVTVLDPSRTRAAQVKADYAILKTLPGGYSLFFSKDVRFEITGRRGGYSRARLSETLSGWLDTDRLDFLPDGTPPPRGTVGQWVRTEPAAGGVQVKIRLWEKIPFEVVETVEPLGFIIRFYGADERFDRIVYRTDDPVVKELRWRQESADVVEVSVQTRLRWGWGYHADYDDEGYFVLEIRRPPDLSRSGNVLAGRKVVIDPGHGPMEWSHGPHGYNERDLVLKVGLKLERMLLAEGAEVYMIRRSTDGPPLAQRPVLAWEAKGDVYVSVHFNGFRETWNPRSSPRGFTTFYYQPHSLPLVEAMHESYRKRHSDLADEHIRWGDLHVLRLTEMPSVLTESAYLALPEHERFIIQDSYQERVAGTMLEGLRAFYEEYRDIQRRSPAERIAAGAP